MATDLIHQQSIATTVHQLAARGLRRLLVTSTAPGEGKSSVCADVGHALARSGGESVVLLDVDSFNPTLHRLLGLSARRGLGDVLEEAYLLDIGREDPLQFGLGDWFDILRAQRRTGELVVTEGDHHFSVRFVKGSIYCVIEPGAEEATRLGELLVRRDCITAEQKQHALAIHQESGRPLGELLKVMGGVAPEALAAALHDQASQRMLRLVALRQPECNFRELAEAYLPAAGGRTPAMSEAEGIDSQVTEGMRDYLRDPFLSCQVPSYLSDTDLANLKVLTAGSRSCDLLEPRYLQPFDLLVKRLARVFDVVLIDAPPVGLGSPATSLASLADGVLLVVKADCTTIDNIRHAVEDLRRAGGRLVGAVLNQLDAKHETVRSPYYDALMAHVR